jgi:hypothetical protein
MWARSWARLAPFTARVSLDLGAIAAPLPEAPAELVRSWVALVPLTADRCDRSYCRLAAWLAHLVSW